LFEAIKDYLAKRNLTDLEYTYRGHQVRQYVGDAEVNPKLLREIQTNHGYDAACWVLYKHFRERQSFIDFNNFIDQNRATVYSKNYKDYLVFTMTHNPWVSRKVNEDYQWQMKNFAVDAGFDVSYPEIPYQRSIFPNAYYYQDILKRFAGRKVILLTHSLATLETRWLLERSQQLDVRIAGWLNLSGLLYGTSLPPSSRDWWYSVKQYFGDEYPVLKEVSRANSYCYGNLKFPVNFPMVNVLGFKPSKYFSVTDAIRDRELKHWGPHDGFVTHMDYLNSPGVVWPILGQDHYLNLTGYRTRLQSALKWIVDQDM